MKPQIPYRYSVLRYVHDVRTEEFLNVGILFHAPEKALLSFLGIEKTGRLSGAFPGVDTERVIDSLTRIAKDFGRFEDASQRATIELVRSAVLPNDDSSFQWAPAGSGVCEDVTKAMDSIFLRFVGRYERRNVKRVRSDADIWGALRQELERRHVLGRLRRATITTPLRSYQFPHAWENHRLHALKPFSLDGVSREEIADKATQWAGVMRDLSRSTGEFQLHLVVGESPQAGSKIRSRARAIFCGTARTEFDLLFMRKQKSRTWRTGLLTMLHRKASPQLDQHRSSLRRDTACHESRRCQESAKNSIESFVVTASEPCI